MTYKHLGLAVLGLALLQGSAYAEMISGTIAGIDPQAKKMTLVRSDNQNQLTLKVKDQAQLLGLQPGHTVVVDADRRFFGGWSVDTVTMSNSAGSEANLNSAGDAAASIDARGNPVSSASANQPRMETPVTDTVAASARPENANGMQRAGENNPNPTADTTY